MSPLALQYRAWIEQLLGEPLQATPEAFTGQDATVLDTFHRIALIGQRGMERVS
jgi:hypothetical protein